MGFFDRVRSMFSPAPSDALPAKTRDVFMAVVRESEGANQLEDALTPTGPGEVELPDGRRIMHDAAWWQFVGDIHVRFVFDGPSTMMGAMREDLPGLGVASVDDALALALFNIHRVYGPPAATPWQDGVFIVSGGSPDLDSSYFLDRDFWREEAAKHPAGGLVVAVPKRGGLLFTPRANEAAVGLMRANVAGLFLSSEQMRVSSALYLFQDGKWSVFQPPIAVTDA